jgi:uncharacterized protein YycO
MGNKTIMLRFVEDSSITSRAIKFFSHGNWSHVDVMFTTLLGGKRLVGARINGGVMTRMWDYKKFSKQMIITVPVSDEAWSKALNFLNAQIGKPYDWTAIAAFAFNRDWRETDSWFCSELAAAYLQSANVLPTKMADGVNKITPSDLVLMLSAMGYDGLAEPA